MPRRKRPAPALPDAGLNDGITRRAAEPRDLDAVARIWLDGWLSTGITLSQQPDYPLLRGRIEREIAGGWQIVVAMIDGQVAGFVAINRSAAVLEQIFVDPRFHRRGVGTALLKAARAEMPGGFTLWTHGDNRRAAVFYERSGMTLVSHGIHPRQSHAIITYGFGPVSSGEPA